MQNYHIYEEIGTGRGSTVFKGRRKRSIRYVAVKRVEKAQKTKVMNEVSVLYTMDHPNVLKFQGWYETSNHLWLIVEYCAGGDLLAMLRQDVALPEASIKVFARDILSGLMYVHSRGFLYCDLKPSNVLVNEYGMLKLADFALSCSIPSDRPTTASPGGTLLIDGITGSGSSDAANNVQRRGSPYYMAPELYRADGIASYASDIWALGCLLFELASGQPPFFSRSMQELVQRIISSAPSPLPAAGTTITVENRHHKVEAFSPAFSSFISRCLEKDPLKRITWSEIVHHELMTGSDLTLLPLPSQPLFDALLATAALNAHVNAQDSPTGNTRSFFGGQQRRRSRSSSNGSSNGSNSGDDDTSTSAAAAAATMTTTTAPATSGLGSTTTAAAAPSSSGLGLTIATNHGGNHSSHNHHSHHHATGGIDVVRLSMVAKRHMAREGKEDDDARAKAAAAQHRSGGNGGDEPHNINSNGGMIGVIAPEHKQSSSSAGGNGSSGVTSTDEEVEENIEGVSPSSDNGDNDNDHYGNHYQSSSSSSSSDSKSSHTIAPNTTPPVIERRASGIDDTDSDIALANFDVELNFTDALTNGGTPSSGAPTRPGHKRHSSGGTSSIPSGARMIAPAAAVVARSAAGTGDRPSSPHGTTRSFSHTSSSRSPAHHHRRMSGGGGGGSGGGGKLTPHEMLILVEEAKSVRQGMVDEKEHDRNDFDVSSSSASASSSSAAMVPSSRRPHSATSILGNTSSAGSGVSGVGSPRLMRPQSALGIAPTSSGPTQQAGGAAPYGANSTMLAAPMAPNSMRASNGISSIVRPQHDVPMIDQLIIHANDFAVRPLVGNTLIEKIAAPSLRADVIRSRSLPFKLLAAKELAMLPQPDLEAFVNIVTRSLSSPLPSSSLSAGVALAQAVAMRVNIIVYLQTVASDPSVANIIINSSIMTLLVRLLKNASVPLGSSSGGTAATTAKAAEKDTITIKVQLLLLCGLLLRYTTHINGDLAQSGLLTVLAESIRDANAMIRRRAMCALGELLFYLAAQDQNSGTTASPAQVSSAMAAATPVLGVCSTSWGLTSFPIKMVARCLRNVEEEIIQHYAAKTIQNIACQCAIQSSWFADVDVALALWNIFSATRNGSVRACTLGAISTLCRRDPTLLPKFIGKAGLAFVIGALDDDNPRVVLAALNMLSTCITERSRLARFDAFLQSVEARVTVIILKLLTSPLSGDTNSTASLRQSSSSSSSSQRGGGTAAAATNGGNTAANNAASDQLRMLIRAKVICVVCLLSSISTRWICDLCLPQTVVSSSSSSPLTPRSMVSSSSSSSLSSTGVPSVSASASFRGATPTTLIAAMDKLIRDGAANTYLMQCCHRFALMLPSWLEAIVNDTTTIISKIGARKHVPTELAKQFKMVLQGYPILTHVSSSTTPFIYSAVCTPNIVLALSDHVKLLSIGSPLQMAGSEQFVTTLLASLAAISSVPDVLWADGFDFNQTLTSLLPSLCSLLSASEVDHRFAGLKLLSDLLLRFISLPQLYDASLRFDASSTGVTSPISPTPPSLSHASSLQPPVTFGSSTPGRHVRRVSSSPAAAGTAAATAANHLEKYTRAMNDLIVHHVIPRCCDLLIDRDPIPQYTLKLLSGIVATNPAIFAEPVARFAYSPADVPPAAGAAAGGHHDDFVPSGLCARLLMGFTPSHANNSLHSVHLLSMLIRYADTTDSRQILYSLGVVQCVTSMVSYAASDRITSFYEPLLDAVHCLLATKPQRDDESKRGTSAGAARRTGSLPMDYRTWLTVNEPLAACAKELPLLTAAACDDCNQYASTMTITTPSVEGVEAMIAERAASALMLLVSLYPNQTADSVCSADSMADMAVACALSLPPTPLPSVIRSIITTLSVLIHHRASLAPHILGSNHIALSQHIAQLAAMNQSQPLPQLAYDVVQHFIQLWDPPQPVA